MRPIFAITLFAGLALGWLHPQPVRGQNARPDWDKIRSEEQMNVQGLLTADPRSFVEQAGRESLHREELIKILIKTLDRNRDARIREHAANLLRTFRAEEAIPALLQHLTEFRATFSLNATMDPSIGSYPCAIALVAIGKPAIDPLIWNLTGHQYRDRNDPTVIAYVLDRIVGHEEAIRRLTKAMEKNRDDVARANDAAEGATFEADPHLQQALQALSSDPEGLHHRPDESNQ